MAAAFFAATSASALRGAAGRDCVRQAVLKACGGGWDEIVERYRTDAYRACLTAHLRMPSTCWHGGSGRSQNPGITTPKHEIELILSACRAERHQGNVN